MRKDERLKTIYETIAPHITRSESAWRDYLEFSSKFYKYSFDNALLVFAQNPNVTMLAPTVVWNKVGRYVNKGSTGIAVCEYENARLTIKHLFDISQTHGKDVIATNWQFDEDMRKHIVSNITEGYNLNITDFAEWIRQVCSKAVIDDSNNYMQVFKDDFDKNIFAELPKDGLEMQLQELIKDSTTYFVGKRCGLTDEEIKLEHGMATIAHFNTVPLIAKLGHMVTDISRDILGEIERSVKTIEKERSAENEQNRNDLHREGWDENSRYPDIQQQGGRQATREVRQDGHGIPERTKPTAIYDFENGWHTDGDYAQSTRGSSGEDRESNTTDVKDRPDAKHGGHYGENQTPEQSEIIGRGNGDASGSLPSEINKEPNIQNKEQSQSKESLVDGSFFVPKEENNLDESDKDGELLKVLIVEQGKTPYVTEIKNGYREFQQQIGGRFTTIEIENGIDAICNDDVYFEDTPINRIISGQAIFGTFLIARVGDDGEYISLSDIDIKRFYKQFEIPLVDIIDLVNQYEDIPEIEFDPLHKEIKPIPNKNSRANELGTQETLFDTVTNHDERRIETILLEGSGVQGGKKRIYDFAMTNPTGSAFAGFLKNEYGIGGHSVNKDGIRFENHDSRGIEFEWIDDNGNKNKTKVSWVQAAIGIQKLIDQERYLDSQEVEIEDVLDNTEDDYQYEKYFMLKTELEDLKKELNEIETKWESEDGSSYTELKFWQDLQSLKHDLEKELEEMEYRQNFDEKSTNEEESNHQKVGTDSYLVDEEELVEPKNVKTNFRYSKTYDLYPNGAKTKYRNNIEAIKLLKRIEEENRFASLDEQIILARYVGWGGLANAFSDTASGWENEYHELKVLLDEKEYEDARNSTITAYYTEPELIKCMYNAFERFGFSGGSDRKILDPAMGTGNFFSVIPEELARTSLYGVEIDSITGRIAKQLYQNANIFVQGYETTNFKDNSFDVVLGNIPFNNIKLYDKSAFVN